MAASKVTAHDAFCHPDYWLRDAWSIIKER
jgi:hypothetical protein